eukprot:2887732-Karenia_brevis.AAC.1
MYRPEDDSIRQMCDLQVSPPFYQIDVQRYVDKTFPREDRVDDHEHCLVINVEMEKIFTNLG